MGAESPDDPVLPPRVPDASDPARNGADPSRHGTTLEIEKLNVELASAKIDLEQKTVTLAQTKREESAPGRWSRAFAGSVPIMVGLLTAFIGWNVTLLGEHAKQTSDAFAKSAADALSPGDPGLRLRGAISLYDLAKNERPETSAHSVMGSIGRVVFGSQEYIGDQAAAILSRRLASETDLAVLEALADLLGT
ncbi:MAG: hypothetical protein IAI50_06120, partial [Candidatus Eremiobacteraeota bacterium]|nr:hypothetical protein [Candidatus Eremiobacteraeota bacterium]